MDLIFLIWWSVFRRIPGNEYASLEHPRAPTTSVSKLLGVCGYQGGVYYPCLCPPNPEGGGWTPISDLNSPNSTCPSPVPQSLGVWKQAPEAVQPLRGSVSGDHRWVVRFSQVEAVKVCWSQPRVTPGVRRNRIRRRLVPTVRRPTSGVVFQVPWVPGCI